jgi:hypothetical protein
MRIGGSLEGRANDLEIALRLDELDRIRSA